MKNEKIKIMENKKYRICLKIDYDKFGKIENKKYFIQKKKGIFWGLLKYWSSITYRECYESGCYDSTTYFKSLKEAETFDNNILIPGKKYGNVNETKIIKTIN